MYRIGVDIGGTNIKIGLVDEDLAITARSSIPFPHLSGEEVAAKIAAEIRRLLAANNIPEQELESIGVVIPGSIDPTGSIILDAYNLNFHDVPFQAQMQAQFNNLPVFLANDADGACLAELGRGAFVGCHAAVLMTLGTGVGGGLIIDGKMYNGGQHQGVELGHMPLVAGGEHCTCGNDGCIEAYCSASALKRDGIRAMKEHPDSILSQKSNGNEDLVDAKFVIDCAKAGDPVANAVFDRYAQYLAYACVSMVHLLDPEVIAFGGGVCLAGDFLFDAIRKHVKKKTFFRNQAKIVPAVMGNDAGMIGAAMLSRNA